MEIKGTVFNIQKFCVHDGPGIRTTVFLKGCPLRCLWCANPESQSPAPEADLEGSVYGAEKTVGEVLAQVLQDRPFYEESGGGVTLSGGEPLYQIDFACALLAACKSSGLHTAAETTGCLSRGGFLRAAEYVDLFLFDVKHFDAARHRAGTGGDNRLILENLGWLTENGRDVIARIPVIPGFNAGLADAQGLAGLLSGLGVKRVSLLPFHQFGEKKYALLGRPYAFADAPALKEADLAAYRRVFLEGGLEVL